VRTPKPPVYHRLATWLARALPLARCLGLDAGCPLAAAFPSGIGGTYAALAGLWGCSRCDWQTRIPGGDCTGSSYRRATRPTATKDSPANGTSATAVRSVSWMWAQAGR